MNGPFTLKGYDKDADAYSVMSVSPDLAVMEQIATSVTDYHLHKRELRRRENNEPFDWFVITDADDNVIRIFTSEFPNGHDPL